MDLSRTGPWHADMRCEEGNQYKLSGQVTRVSAPETIGFTWAWHDTEDQRGPESHVTFTVEAMPNGGARLIIDHRELPTEEEAKRHEGGWSAGPLPRLERFLAEFPN